MKNSTLILCSLLFAFTISSCNNEKPKNNNDNQKETKEEIDPYITDIKKIIRSIEDYTKLAVKAAKDKVLDDNEIKKLKNSAYELDEIEKEIDKKYAENKEGQEAIENYIEDNHEDLEIIYEDFIAAKMSLYECEGADKLD